jgi:hypothetical protein
MRARLLLLTRLLLVKYLLLDVLVLKGTLSSIVRASMGELLLRGERLGRHHLSSIGRGLGKMGSLSGCSLGDMVGRKLLLSATVAVFGLVVGASCLGGGCVAVLLRFARKASISATLTG